MKHLLYIFKTAAIIAAISIFNGCTDELELPDTDKTPDELAEYYFILSSPAESRSVDYTDDKHSEFTGGEQLGCFALDETGNMAPGSKANACYAVSVISSANPDIDGSKVLVPQTTNDKLDKGYPKYLFYYPYNKDIKSPDELKDLSHTVMVDQSEEEDYEKSDLLWDMAVPTERYCKVEMDHAMANIVIVIDGIEYDVDKGAMVLQQPLTATGINLTAPTIEDMWKTDGSYYYKVEESQPLADIRAMYAMYSDANDRFRAAVPANRTLKAGSKIIKLWSKATGTEKTFTLKNDIRLEAGKNYYFTLIKKGKPNPEETNDESWVLDVLDPETGARVGLLCREYLRFQETNDYEKPVRGTPTTPGTDTQKATLNSQAWVFYNLQDNGKIPELSVGTVLRFVYDVRINLAGNTGDGDDTPTDYDETKGTSGYAWPAPHYDYSYWGGAGFGIFLAKHEYGWSQDESGHGIPANPKAFRGEFYMHGGTVLWNGAENLIDDFIMPARENSATNDVADKYAHIAIPSDGSAPYVSYSMFDEGASVDEDGCKIGFTMPHTLIDIRITEHGKREIRRYPLVKIGFNQFWMSKSLRAKTLVDGTPLHCFNTAPCAFTIDDSHPPFSPSGYLYPFYAERNYDPYFDLQDGKYSEYGEYADEELEMPLLYNSRAFEDDRLLPKSVEGISRYVRPSEEEYRKFGRYCGYASITKMMSNDMLVFDGRSESDRTDEEMIEAFKHGKLLKKPGCYCANVSGLNLKAFGCRMQGPTAFKQMGKAAGFWIESGNYETGGIVCPLYQDFDSYGTPILTSTCLIDNSPTNTIYLYPRNDWDYDWDPTIKQRVPWSRNLQFAYGTFNQVRFLLKYNNQKEGPASRSIRTTRNKTAKHSYNVYVSVE